MSGFLYYLPGVVKPQVTLDDVEQFGLRYAFDAKPVACLVHHGPDGNQGSVIVRPKSVESVGYHPDRQHWQKSGDGEWWIGYETGSPPTPSDLERPQLLLGQDVRLADGNLWHVPIARSITESGFLVNRLPCAMSYRDGEWIDGEVLSAYVELWDVANAAFDKYINGLEAAAGNSDAEAMTISFSEAALALSANYYVQNDEASLLQLFTSTGPEMLSVIRTLCDIESFLRYAQKKTAEAAAGDSDSTLHGEPE